MKSKYADISKNGTNWVYSEKVKEHFFQPRNFVRGYAPRWKFNGYGESGSAACGDVMRVWIWVDEKSKKIKKFGWKTFGCASAIATTSILSEMILESGGMPIQQAIKITPLDIIRRLSGLPPKKVHCSVLGDQALRLAIKDFRRAANPALLTPDSPFQGSRVKNR